jgi:hypothetical protein
MLITILGVCLLAIALITWSIIKEVEAGALAVLLFSVPFLLISLAGQDVPRDYNFKASVVDGVFEKVILLRDASQEGNKVTIDVYYKTALHWFDFRRYNRYETPICIELPRGKPFKYEVWRTFEDKQYRVPCP